MFSRGFTHSSFFCHAACPAFAHHALTHMRNRAHARPTGRVDACSSSDLRATPRRQIALPKRSRTGRRGGSTRRSSSTCGRRRWQRWTRATAKGRTSSSQRKSCARRRNGMSGENCSGREASVAWTRCRRSPRASTWPSRPRRRQRNGVAPAPTPASEHTESIRRLEARSTYFCGRLLTA